MFIWWELLGLQVWETASRDTLRKLLLRDCRGIRGYKSLQQGSNSLNNNILLLIKEKQISQVKDFSTFL